MTDSNTTNESGTGEGAQRSTIVRNVLANWLWSLMVMAIGFVLPRLIDGNLGREMLGVWDYGWLLVFFISLLALGVTSAVNRYVARFRAKSEWDGLNEMINSCLLLLGASFVMGIGGAFLSALLIDADTFDTPPPPEMLSVARWTIFLLCAGAAIQLPGGAFNGVITGYERYDLLNLIRGTRDIIVFGIIVIVLISGCNLAVVAGVKLVGEIVGESLKCVFAFRLCPQLRVSPGLATRRMVRETMSFGARTLLQDFARSGNYYINSLIVKSYLGLGPLAIYSRQRSLVMHLMRFVKQYALVFTPGASTLHAQGRTDELRRLAIQCVTYALYVTLPAAAVLLIMGGPLLNIWMGPDYEAPLVLGVMVASHLLAIPQMGLFSILVGMNRHGVPAAMELIAAAISVAFGYIALGPMSGSMIWAAVAMSLPIAASSGIAIPLYACRQLGINPGTYVARVFPGPALAVAPLAACLLGARWFFADQPRIALLVGGGIGGIISLPVYWRWAIPESVKTRIVLKLKPAQTR